MTTLNNLFTSVKLVTGLIFVCLPVQAEFAATAVDYANQSITLALNQEPPQMSSLTATDSVSFFVQSHVMEGLVRYDKRGRIAPGVAERWEIDAQGATFWLRDDALWSGQQPGC